MRKLIVLALLVVGIGFAIRGVDRIWAHLRGGDTSTEAGYRDYYLDHTLGIDSRQEGLMLIGNLLNGGDRRLTNVRVVVRFGRAEESLDSRRSFDLGGFDPMEQRGVEERVGSGAGLGDRVWYEIRVESVSFADDGPGGR